MFRQTVEEALYNTAALRSWYVGLIDEIGQRTAVFSINIEGLSWSEIDLLSDLYVAAATVAAWMREGFQSSEMMPAA
ncbi:hypothetical protein Q4F19_07380 [Sphingomonas sp. BIUV-7]|uniref:Uncharacterized protein n=1 Tax=Sphingomonas natans TaxID=3063330 RepID=A0ABT8Y7B6_9SPHN|nr:hypothetical protein [Sphingomonas sp. BIUV-7]MDO6414199.1 hypothetical protein [Sphingomonas sp. BIUV-7]